MVFGTAGEGYLNGFLEKNSSQNIWTSKIFFARKSRIPYFNLRGDFDLTIFRRRVERDAWPKCEVSTLCQG
jgi:hypothetical protein